MRTESDNRKAGALKVRFARRHLSRIVGGRVLVLGALVTALAVSFGLALAVSAEEVRAQDAVNVYGATISVAEDPDSKYF